MSPLQQQLRWRAEQLGWPGISAIVLLLFAMLVYVIALMPAQQQLLQLEQALGNEQQRSQMQLAHAKSIEASESTKQARFYNDFPHQRDISKTLERLYGAAKRSGLTLQRGE